MSELSPAAILIDEDGHQVGVVLDGAVYRLQQVGKLLNAAGSQINPATEDTLALIKNTDGIKKITDPVAVTDNSSSLTTDTAQLPGALVSGRLDANLGAWLGSTAPTVGQKTMAASVPVAVASDQSPLPVSVSAVATTMLANVIKTSAWTITTRTETQVTALNYTVTAGKTFYLSYLGGSAHAPLSIIIRLKVAGVIVFFATAWHMENLAIALPLPAPIATAGQQITVTYEAQIPNGSAWAGFTGIEV